MIRQPMLLLLLGAGMVNFLLAEPLDGAMLMAFVVVVIAISIYQEHKTERALDALRDLSSPRALVIRDGVQRRVAGRDVVRGDLLLLAEGDRVPADAVLVDCANFSLDESALTGESVPVRKVAIEPDGAPGDDGARGRGRRAVGVLGHAGGQRATAWPSPGNRRRHRAGTDRRGAANHRAAAHPAAARNPTAWCGFSLSSGLAAARVGGQSSTGLTRGNWLARACWPASRRRWRILPEEFPVVLTVFLALGAWRMSRQACAHAPHPRGRDARLRDRPLRRQDRHPHR